MTQLISLYNFQRQLAPGRWNIARVPAMRYRQKTKAVAVYALSRPFVLLRYQVILLLLIFFFGEIPNLFQSSQQPTFVGANLHGSDVQSKGYVHTSCSASSPPPSSQSCSRPAYCSTTAVRWSKSSIECQISWFAPSLPRRTSLRQRRIVCGFGLVEL